MPWTMSVEIGSPTVEIAAPTLEEISLFPTDGSFMVFFPGRSGDNLKVDGRAVGSLPATVRLTQGTHTFEVSGPSGDLVQLNLDVTVDPNVSQGRILLSE